MKQKLSSKSTLDESKLPQLPLSPTELNHREKKSEKKPTAASKPKPLPKTHPSQAPVRRVSLFGDDDSTAAMEIDDEFPLLAEQPTACAAVTMESITAEHAQPDSEEEEPTSKRRRTTKARRIQQPPAASQSKKASQPQAASAQQEVEEVDPFAFV